MEFPPKRTFDGQRNSKGRANNCPGQSLSYGRGAKYGAAATITLSRYTF